MVAIGTFLVQIGSHAKAPRMIRMTKLADYGIVLLTHMAMEAPGSLHTAQDLAARSRVPVPTASKQIGRAHV